MEWFTVANKYMLALQPRSPFYATLELVVNLEWNNFENKVDSALIIVCIIATSFLSFVTSFIISFSVMYVFNFFLCIFISLLSFFPLFFSSTFSSFSLYFCIKTKTRGTFWKSIFTKTSNFAFTKTSNPASIR